LSADPVEPDEPDEPDPPLPVTKASLELAVAEVET